MDMLAELRDDRRGQETPAPAIRRDQLCPVIAWCRMLAMGAHQE